MADVQKIATREAYGKALVELGKEHDDLLVFDADLAEATRSGKYGEEYPERFVDCGIAEANMIGMAAGVAATGHKVFATSFAMFTSGRAFEQIRNSVGYPHLNVKIGATHGGLSVGEDGATHQCNEDIAVMRTIPGMTVIIPSDAVEAEAAVKALTTMTALFTCALVASLFLCSIPTLITTLSWARVLFSKRAPDVTLVACGLWFLWLLRLQSS